MARNPAKSGVSKERHAFSLHFLPALSPLPWILATLGASIGPISDLQWRGVSRRRSLWAGPAAVFTDLPPAPSPTPITRSRPQMPPMRIGIRLEDPKNLVW